MCIYLDSGKISHLVVDGKKQNPFIIIISADTTKILEKYSI